ncbi:hypothetical protein NYY70_21115, partial [Acinetobacter baumannii]|nr:hypothetical protein [Acinetobacter baumannii]
VTGRVIAECGAPVEPLLRKPCPRLKKVQGSCAFVRVDSAARSCDAVLLSRPRQSCDRPEPEVCRAMLPELRVLYFEDLEVGLSETLS